MYQYTDFDRQFVQQRAAQYRDQLQRNLSGQLGDEEFKPLRLQNGWYLQRFAPMLRVAVPYGELSSAQLRVLAKIARVSLVNVVLIFFIKITGDFGQHAKLRAGQLAIRYGHPQHGCETLQIPAVLQSQRLELFVA